MGPLLFLRDNNFSRQSHSTTFDFTICQEFTTPPPTHKAYYAGIEFFLTVGEEGFKDFFNSGSDLDIDEVVVLLLLFEDVSDGMCRQELCMQ